MNERSVETVWGCPPNKGDLSVMVFFVCVLCLADDTRSLFLKERYGSGY